MCKSNQIRSRDGRLDLQSSLGKKKQNKVTDEIGRFPEERDEEPLLPDSRDAGTEIKTPKVVLMTFQRTLS